MNYPINFDRSLTALVAKIPAKAAGLFTLSSALASPAIMMGLLLVGFLIFRNSSEASKMLLVLAVSPLAEGIKMVTRRARPETLYAKKMKIKTFSFPSGHSYISALVYSFCAYLAYHYLNTPFGLLIAIGLVLLIFMVGVSRVYLGAHFPSDVLAGWTLGALMSIIIIAIAPEII